mgnify:CR=1 FL=1
MNKKEFFEQIKGKVIVSCQALPGEPLYVEEKSVMYLMARAGKQAGTPAIRTSSIRDVVAIKEETGLPVIGLIKVHYPGFDGFITPTMKEIEELMEVKPEIIALDATFDLKPGGRTLDGFYREIRDAYPDQLLMADCSTVEEALHADELGFDFIGTTLVGYTQQSRGLKIEADDFAIIRQIVAKVRHRVIAEGNINTPEKARRVIELGAFSVVVGSIITRPQLITKSFAEALK